MKNTKSSRPERAARLLDMKAMQAEGKTLAEIGAKYGISRQRVCQLLNDKEK